jgi:hypothetical protein
MATAELTVPRTTIVEDIARAQRLRGRRARTVFILVWAATSILLAVTSRRSSEARRLPRALS